MVTRNQIVEFVRSSPGCRSAEVGQALNIPTNIAATRLKQILDAGYLTRTPLDISTRGTTIYGYYTPEGVEGLVKQERIAVAQASAPRSLDVPIKVTSLDAILSDFVGSFAKSLAGAIVEQLKPRLEMELRQALPAALPAPIAPLMPQNQEVVTYRKRRIGVTGLLPQQAGAIQQEFGDTFDISFWNDRNGDGLSKLKSIGIGCEAVFVHIAHASHKTDQTLKSVGAKLVRVNGGLSQMRDTLTRYYVEGTA